MPSFRAPLTKLITGIWVDGETWPQKGVTSYALSPNRQRPLAGTLSAAVFNSYRRFKGQVLYVAPPFIIAYFAMGWATEKNHFYNSKAGRLAEEAEAE